MGLCAKAPSDAPSTLGPGDEAAEAMGHFGADGLAVFHATAEDGADDLEALQPFFQTPRSLDKVRGLSLRWLLRWLLRNGVVWGVPF